MPLPFGLTDMAAHETGSLLSIRDLKVHFPIEKTLLDKLFSGGKIRYVRAVDGVDLELEQGKTVGLVGESGSGKSTLALSIIGLAHLTAGTIIYKDIPISLAARKERRRILKYIQMVFQDPFSSLNPAMKVKEIVGRQFRISAEKYSAREISENVEQILARVGLKKEAMERYPHEFSGGQKQRISLARALAPRPEILIADEITSALDVSIQSQIIALLLDLKESSNLTMLYITHDLRVARLITDEIAVMYKGKIVEYGRTADIFREPMHPYTKALLTAIPRNNYKEKISLDAAPSSSSPRIDACPLYERCPFREAECTRENPKLVTIPGGRRVACYRFREAGERA
jgi:peptide/nickel transport system ATP-binding protein